MFAFSGSDNQICKVIVTAHANCIHFRQNNAFLRRHYSEDSGPQVKVIIYLVRAVETPKCVPIRGKKKCGGPNIKATSSVDPSRGGNRSETRLSQGDVDELTS